MGVVFLLMVNLRYMRMSDHLTKIISHHRQQTDSARQQPVLCKRMVANKTANLMCQFPVVYMLDFVLARVLSCHLINEYLYRLSVSAASGVIHIAVTQSGLVRVLALHSTSAFVDAGATIDHDYI